MQPFESYRLRHLLPRYDYDQAGGFGHGWQAYAGADKIGPERMFQWEAIADLPDEANVRAESGGRYSVVEPYRVGMVLNGGIYASS